MQEKKKLVFIVNPISGTGRRESRKDLIDRYIDRDVFDFEIVETEYAGHAVSLASEAAAAGCYGVVAVGGDGTVNEVGRGLVETGTAMGIIPCGSGNGLALHLGIPRDFRRAVGSLAHNRPVGVDYGKMNGHCFFTTCGIGFDASVSRKFAEAKHRGLLTYVKIALHEYWKYRPETYSLAADGTEMEKCAFLMTCANADQWGNNSFIAPEASLCDGLLDVAVISPFRLLDVPMLAHRLMHGSLAKSSLFEEIKCRSLTVRRTGKTTAHCDGDPLVLDGDINIDIVRSGLSLLVPELSSNI